MNLIHISDIHFRNGWHEEQGVVFDAFINDLKQQIDNSTDNFLIISGDVVQSGDTNEQFVGFSQLFDKSLSELGIPNEKRIVVPGNHDMSRKYVKDNLMFFESIASLEVDETVFNNKVSGELANPLKEKFHHYSNFVSGFAKYSSSVENITGSGHALNDSVGIYCLNTALYSFGGLEGLNGKKLNDKQLLNIDTRKIHEWISSTSFETKILVMHHPLEWLSNWSKNELQRLIQNNFRIVYFGHIHKANAIYSSGGRNEYLSLTAPALFSSKHDTLGYSITSINENSFEVNYRTWSLDHLYFVSGTLLSGTCPSSYKMAQVSARAKRDFSLINVG